MKIKLQDQISLTGEICNIFGMKCLFPTGQVKGCLYKWPDILKLSFVSFISGHVLEYFGGVALLKCIQIFFQSS